MGDDAHAPGSAEWEHLLARARLAIEHSHAVGLEVERVAATVRRDRAPAARAVGQRAQARAVRAEGRPGSSRAGTATP